MKITLISLFVFFLTYGCNSNKIPIKKLNTTNVVSEFSDSTFLSGPLCDLKSKNNFIYASEVNVNRIIVMDSSLNYQYKIGTTGSGPGEFKGIGHLCINRDSIYAYDTGGNRINVYELSGRYIRQIVLEGANKIHNDFIVSKDGDYIIVSTPKGDYPITAYNLYGRIEYGFGIWVPTLSHKEKIERNFRTLGIDDSGKIIAVLMSEPIIEKYHLSGNLIERLDLSDLDNLNYRLEKVRESQRENRINPSEGFRTAVLFPEISVFGNRVYIVMASHVNETTIKYTNIIEIENAEHFKPIGVLNLEQTSDDISFNWYLSILKTKHTLYANDFLNYCISKFEGEPL